MFRPFLVFIVGLSVFFQVARADIPLSGMDEIVDKTQVEYGLWGSIFGTVEKKVASLVSLAEQRVQDENIAIRNDHCPTGLRQVNQSSISIFTRPTQPMSGTCKETGDRNHRQMKEFKVATQSDCSPKARKKASDSVRKLVQAWVKASLKGKDDDNHWADKVWDISEKLNCSYTDDVEISTQTTNERGEIITDATPPDQWKQDLCTANAIVRLNIIFSDIDERVVINRTWFSNYIIRNRWTCEK